MFLPQLKSSTCLCTTYHNAGQARCPVAQDTGL